MRPEGSGIPSRARPSSPANSGPYLKIVALLAATALFGAVAVTPLVSRLVIAGPEWLPFASVAGVALVTTAAVVLYPRADYTATMVVTALVASGVYLLVGMVVISPALDLEGSMLTLADRGGLTVGSLAIGLLAADIYGSESSEETET